MFSHGGAFSTQPLGWVLCLVPVSTWICDPSPPHALNREIKVQIRESGWGWNSNMRTGLGPEARFPHFWEDTGLTPSHQEVCRAAGVASRRHPFWVCSAFATCSESSVLPPLGSSLTQIRFSPHSGQILTPSAALARVQCVSGWPWPTESVWTTLTK